MCSHVFMHISSLAQLLDLWRVSCVDSIRPLCHIQRMKAFPPFCATWTAAIWWLTLGVMLLLPCLNSGAAHRIWNALWKFISQPPCCPHLGLAEKWCPLTPTNPFLFGVQFCSYRNKLLHWAEKLPLPRSQAVSCVCVCVVWFLA